MSELENFKKSKLVGALDQGTSSSRFLIFHAETGELVTYHQIEVNKIYPNEGWVEQSPTEMYDTLTECIQNVSTKLEIMGQSVSNIACVGLTNQRESTILWNKQTGKLFRSFRLTNQ